MYIIYYEIKQSPVFWGNSVARHQMNPNERESRLSFICYVMFKRIKLLKRCELYSLCS